MNYGLYLSASGVMTNMHRQDVFANNLANVETTGFKSRIPDLTHRAPEAVEDKVDFDVSKRLLERLGGGVFAGPQRIDTTVGQIQQTGNPLDAALTDENSFFAVRATDPDTGQNQVRLTRDGRFTRNDAGQLVTPAGHPVLNADDEPIQVPGTAPVRINHAGELIQNGEPIDRVQVARINDPQQLQHQGAGMFAFEGADPRNILENPSVKAGAVEGSAVDPMTTLMRLIGATKSVGGNAQMIKYHDTLMNRAVNTLGRVA